MDCTRAQPAGVKAGQVGSGRCASVVGGDAGRDTDQELAVLGLGAGVSWWESLPGGAGARVLSGVPESDPVSSRWRSSGPRGPWGSSLRTARRQLRVGDRLCLVLWGASSWGFPRGALLSSAASAAVFLRVVFFGSNGSFVFGPVSHSFWTLSLMSW